MTAAGFCPMAARTPAPRGETGSSGAPPDHPGGAPDFSLYPSGFTQLSNALRAGTMMVGLCTPLDLHSSQTPLNSGTRPRPLCTPLDLHSSQTGFHAFCRCRKLCTPLDLHSSQTDAQDRLARRELCTPLDLHSSQTGHLFRPHAAALCTPLDLHSSQTRAGSGAPGAGFVPLWIYTALKLVAQRVYDVCALYPSGFTQLSNAV